MVREKYYHERDSEIPTIKEVLRDYSLAEIHNDELVGKAVQLGSRTTGAVSVVVVASRTCNRTDVVHTTYVVRDRFTSAIEREGGGGRERIQETPGELSSLGNVCV